MTTTDSNAWGGALGPHLLVHTLPGGKTRVDAIVVRDGKNLKGRFFAVVFRVFGKQVLGNAFQKTIRAIEQRSNATPRFS